MHDFFMYRFQTRAIINSYHIAPNSSRTNSVPTVGSTERLAWMSPKKLMVVKPMRPMDAIIIIVI